jgi:hypothetical protein
MREITIKIPDDVAVVALSSDERALRQRLILMLAREIARISPEAAEHLIEANTVPLLEVIA